MHYIRGPDVVFEVEYLWNGWIKMNKINANLALYEWPTLLDTPIDFAFSPHLTFV